jgi:hypothetical protein
LQVARLSVKMSAKEDSRPMRRSPPTFQPGPLTRTQAEALNQLARDLYGSLLDRFSAAPPLQVRQGLDGVAFSLGPIETASGIVTRTTVGSVHSADYGPRPRLNFTEGSNIVIGMADDPTDNEIDITISATAPAGVGIEVKAVSGTPDYTGVSLLIVDGVNLTLSQPAAGQAQVTYVNTDPDANLTTRGWVSLAAQTLGSGAKTVAGNFTADATLAGGTTSSVTMIASGAVQYTLTVSNINGLPRLAFAGTGATPTPYLGVGAVGSVSGKKVFDLVSADGYAFGNVLGVTGTGGGGDTYSGGICTGTGTLSPGTGIGISGSTISNTGVTSIIAGSGISVSSATGAVTVSLTVPVTIARGGTNSGAALNNSRIMVSSGGAIVEAAALTNGQLLIGSTGAAPAAATITAGAGITITNAAGAITIAATAPSMTNARLTADAGTALLTATDITGLSFSVLSGEVWSFEVFIRNNKSSLTAGIKYAINAPAASTLEAQIQGTTSATTAVQHERMSGLTTLTTAAFNTVANADGFVRIAGVVVAGANGTVQIQHAAVTSQTATARANSYITARKIA